jgi:uncharacterized membrane protein (DUF106 family)
MNFIFSGVNALFRLIFYPFENLNPAWGMIWISIVTGIVMLGIFRLTSNQAGIKKSKAKVSAYILEMRLYSHDLGKMLGSLGKTFLANIFYLRYMITPIIFIIVPVLIVIIQLSFRYEHRPLQTGERVIVKAVLKPDYPVLQIPVALQTPEDVIIETPALRISSLNEIDWRIRVQQDGMFHLKFMVGDRQYEKNLHVDSKLAPLSVRRVGSSMYDSLMNHVEPRMSDDSPFISLNVMYPDRTLRILGIDLHWVIWFFVLSVIWGFALKDLFKVAL